MLALKGEGTTNLRVALGKEADIGGRSFREGDVIDTGLDVPKGAIGPMGMTTKVLGTRTYAGVTCAACHSSVDPETKLVQHGVPNWDFNAGVMIAMASNSAAFFTHTDVDPRTIASTKSTRSIPDSTGTGSHALPDVATMEQAVDAVLMKWPRGNFDSMTDMVAHPAQIPGAFTWNNHPYSHSGAFMAGPFKGLSVQTNNVHALNSDATTEADAAPPRLGLDRELFIATVFQNAPHEKYRFDPAKGKKPSEFLLAIDPTPGQPSMNEVVALPTYPKATLIEPTSLWNSSPGKPVWRQVNAMAAWQNTLVPPAARIPADPAAAQRGRAVFEKANCVSCHRGPALTNNRVVSVAEIKTQGLRGKGMANTENAWDDNPQAYAFDQDVPLPKSPRTIPVPTEQLDKQQITLAYGWGDSPGGYKVPSLIGLYWSPPYLHDGGVAVGPDASKQLGLAGTLQRGVMPDPANSLRAMVDRELRKQVIGANAADPNLSAMRVEGIGHEIWVDAGAGFTEADQHDLIHYLLTYQPDTSTTQPR